MINSIIDLDIMKAAFLPEKIRLNKAGVKSIYLLISGTVLLTASYSILMYAGTARAIALSKEDGPVETISAACWLMATVIMFMVYLKSSAGTGMYFTRTKRNIFYLLLALFFLFCLGEEISWGQRLLGIRTPKAIAGINAQGEINIHNFWIFQAYDRNLQDKTGIAKWISPGKLFTLIWIVYCVMFPIMDMISIKVRRLFNRIHLPVVPLGIGLLFLAAQVVARIFTRVDGIFIHAVVEMKETIFAFLYMAIAISFYSFLDRSQEKKGRMVVEPDNTW